MKTTEETKNTQISANIGKTPKIRLTAEELCEFLAANYETILSKARCHGIPEFAADALQEVVCKLLGAKTGYGRQLKFEGAKTKNGYFEFDSTKDAINALAWHCRARMGALADKENYFKAPAESFAADGDGDCGLSEVESILVAAISNSCGAGERPNPFEIESVDEPRRVDDETGKRARRFDRLQCTFQNEKHDEINPTFVEGVDRRELRILVRKVLECVCKERKIKPDNVRAALLVLLGQCTQKEAVLKFWRVKDDADLVRRCNWLSQIVYRLKKRLKDAFKNEALVQELLAA